MELILIKYFYPFSVQPTPHNNNPLASKLEEHGSEILKMQNGMLDIKNGMNDLKNIVKGLKTDTEIKRADMQLAEMELNNIYNN